METIILLNLLCILSHPTFALTMNAIPGSNCGISTKVRIMKVIEEEDMSKDLGCTLVEDDESFREYMKRKAIALIDSIKKRRWEMCSENKKCTLGDRCLVDAECGGAPGLVCSSNACVACSTVDLCNIGDTCSSDIDCGGAPNLFCLLNECVGVSVE